MWGRAQVGETMEGLSILPGGTVSTSELIVIHQFQQKELSWSQFGAFQEGHLQSVRTMIWGYIVGTDTMKVME